MYDDFELEDRQKYSVSASGFADKLDLKTVYAPDKNLTFYSTATNRPGLLLAGFDGYFPAHRIQLLGNGEAAYLASLSRKEMLERFEILAQKQAPCLIFSRNREPSVEMASIAKKYGIPLYVSALSTSQIESDVMHFLANVLAQSSVLNGELLDISGIGVLLIGESGIGKSETALELVHRGHMLVADDLVEVKRIKHKIYGYASKITGNLLEVRGVGLIDVEAMYGVGGVLGEKRIHLVIEMEKWKPKKDYDRLGDDRNTFNILGIDFERIVIPVSAGRNLAVVIEAASRNYRLKTMGKDALAELNARLAKKNKQS